MIRAGDFSIEDKGFAMSQENISGLPRQSLVIELPGGISDAALEAFCTGPIEVLDEGGNVVQCHDGPFLVVSHGLKLTRTSAAADVAVLNAKVTQLEAELITAQNAKENALGELASLSEQLAALKDTADAPLDGEVGKGDVANATVV